MIARYTKVEKSEGYRKLNGSPVWLLHHRSWLVVYTAGLVVSGMQLLGQ